MNYEEKTLSREEIYRGNIIKVSSLTVALPDGRTATRDVVAHPGASVILPLNERGEAYLVRQFRKPLESMSLELPAGKLDQGEDPGGLRRKGAERGDRPDCRQYKACHKHPHDPGLQRRGHSPLCGHRAHGGRFLHRCGRIPQYGETAGRNPGRHGFER